MNHEQLKQWRLSLSLNIRQMALYMGVCIETYSQWERGTRRIVAATQRLISVLVQVKMVSPMLHNILIKQALQVDIKE